MKRVRPFPYDRLRRLLRAQVEAGRTFGHFFPLAPGDAWPSAVASLGGEVSMQLLETNVLAASDLSLHVAGGAMVLLSAPFGRTALLVLDPALAPQLARRALGIDSAELPAPRPLTVAERGALAFLVAALVDRYPVRVERVFERGSENLEALLGDSRVLACEARVTTPIGGGWARLFAPGRLVHDLPSPHDLYAVHIRKPRLHDVRVALRLEVGRTRLARADFAGIEPRDIVLFEQFGPRPPFGGPTYLRLGGGGFVANLGGDGLTILEPFRLGGWIMNRPDREEGSAESASSTDALLRELPVDVVCELGRVTMSGRELLELQPGMVVPVGRPLAGPVDLTVGSRVVARGELVDVEGEIGVRITQVNE